MSDHIAKKRLLNGLNLKKGAESIKNYPHKQKRKLNIPENSSTRAPQANSTKDMQAIIWISTTRRSRGKLENIGNGIEEMMGSSSEETVHEDRPVKRFSKS
ncbi:hypothetical protein AgCh_025309 [Apium graveolens]